MAGQIGAICKRPSADPPMIHGLPGIIGHLHRIPGVGTGNPYDISHLAAAPLRPKSSDPSFFVHQKGSIRQKICCVASIGIKISTDHPIHDDGIAIGIDHLSLQTLQRSSAAQMRPVRYLQIRPAVGAKNRFSIKIDAGIQPRLRISGVCLTIRSIRQDNAAL